MSEKTILIQKMDWKVFLLICGIMFTIFVFTSDGHRHSGDEDWSQLQTIRMVTMEPHPLYVDGVSQKMFERPTLYPPEAGWFRSVLCNDPIICSPASIGHSVTEFPFVFINYHLKIISDEEFLEVDDFPDAHYIFWRNGIDGNFTFLALFFGPFYVALSVGIFYLINRTYDHSVKISLTLAIILGLTTCFWAYSQTTLNIVPVCFFILLGFLFYRKFALQKTPLPLALCTACLGFGFFIRQDVILFLIPLALLFLFDLIKQKHRIIKIISFIAPLLLFYQLRKSIDSMRFVEDFNEKLIDPSSLLYVGYIDSSNFPFSIFSGIIAFLSPIVDKYSGCSAGCTVIGDVTFPEGLGGLLLSPGVGLFIFIPIMLTVFFSFPDFYRKNKANLVFFISLVSLYVVYFGSLDLWHGLVTWGPRYLMGIIPFMLIPLGASLKIRNKKFLVIILLLLCGAGFLFNLAYVLQDVDWFVWGKAGYDTGLFGLGNQMTELYIHESVKWTFKNSQLTNSLYTLFNSWYPDVLLQKIFGSFGYTLALIGLLTPQIFYLTRIIRKLSQRTMQNTSQQKNK